MTKARWITHDISWATLSDIEIAMCHHSPESGQVMAAAGRMIITGHPATRVPDLPLHGPLE
jgi:hypothetical protein